MENEQADAGRDGRSQLERPNPQARPGAGAGLTTLYVCMYVCICMMTHTSVYSKTNMDQPGKVANNAARG